jgi:NAD(P)-dependent dehydrogenase (short-subunit alcohol dehydrogenase family)
MMNDWSVQQTWETLFGTPRPVAFVTGSAAPRVGRAVLEHLMALGCHAVMHSHHPMTDWPAIPARLSDRGGERLLVDGAVESEQDVKRCFEQIEEHFGRLDICVNSAAIWHPQRLEDVTAADVRRYFEVNALGSFLIAQHAGLRMARQTTGGAIINVGDWATTRPYPDHAAYFPSKGAIEAMTRSLAVELAERNPRVRVNAVLPGPVLFAEDVTPDQRRATAAACLLGRTGTPQHVADAVTFLICNDFVTGVCLPVDGGRSIYAADPLHQCYRTG